VAGVSIDIDVSQLMRAMGGVARATSDMRPAYDEIGEILLSSILSNFAQSGRPIRWPAVARGGKPLDDTGALKKSLSAQPTSADVIVGTNLEYAATHHFGRPPIKARPFMLIQGEDEADIGQAVLDHLVRSFA